MFGYDGGVFFISMLRSTLDGFETRSRGCAGIGLSGGRHALTKWGILLL